MKFLALALEAPVLDLLVDASVWFIAKLVWFVAAVSLMVDVRSGVAGVVVGGAVVVGKGGFLLHRFCSQHCPLQFVSPSSCGNAIGAS